ncbi:MAG: HlyD family efflux transporter periplasmic adaptor subunit [Sphingomonadales bacterium]|nr:HlyD family efflux transporter periplasmic adaptor subunit [Sphingomonadales bacterium]
MQMKVGGQPADPLGEGWRQFSAAGSAHEFCRGWLKVQATLIEGARAGMLILRAETGKFAPAAIWPEGASDPAALAASAEQALGSGQPLVQRFAADEGAPARVQIAYPIRIAEALEGAVVIELIPASEPALRRATHQLYWGAGWLEVLFRRRQAEADGARAEVLQQAMDLAVATLEEPDLAGAAMALINALDAATGARGAAVGLYRGRRLRLQAMSHTAWFNRKSALLDTMLNAMEEVLDQHGPVAWPETAPTAGRISIAHEALSQRLGGSHILGVPLLAAGRPVGAILLEFDPEAPPAPLALALAEAAGAVCGTVLEDRRRADRWFAGRVPRALARFWDDLRDPRQVTGKLALAAVVGVLAALVLVRAPLRVTADAVIEGSVMRAVVSPVEGFVEAAPVRAGEVVRAGDLLAQLDQRDLILEELRLQSEAAQAASAYRDALVRHDRVEASVQQSRQAEAEAQLRLNAAQRARTEIRAPIDGLVVSGDLSREIGSPVEKGQPLFEVAPLESYRVILKVDESHILMVAPGQTGVMSLAAIAGQEMPITIEKVTPVSTPEEGRNYFRVEAQLAPGDAPLRPGMQGVGKVVIRDAPLVWTWVWPAVQWARIKLWSLAP